MKAKAKYGQALRLASTTQLTREQWLAIRKLGIGSSDAAVAVGLSPYKCPLVNQHRKMTRVQRPKLTRVSWLISSSV
ncbi:YqaJ viral recombinase family protein [Aeromonas sanarellii]